MKIFISGKVSGLPYKEVREKFTKAEFILKKKGHVPINPVRIVAPGTEQAAAMKICIKELLTCEAIYMLSDWMDSPGARLEHEVAKQCGLKIIKE